MNGVLSSTRLLITIQTHRSAQTTQYPDGSYLRQGPCTISCDSYWWLDTECELNDVISQCDLLFAAYEDFPNSSNILSKAARFRKPVIVRDGYLMAERVREFRMGEVIEAVGDNSVGDVVRRVTDDLDGWVDVVEPRWDDYIRENNYGRLMDRVEELLDYSMSGAD